MNTKKIAAFAVMSAVGVSALAGTTFAASNTTTNTSTKMEKHGHRGPKDNTQFAADLASALGMTEADVKAKLDAGTKPDDIITAAGKDKTTVMTAMHALRLQSMKTKIAEDVASGKITQTQADKILSNIANHKEGEHGGKKFGASHFKNKTKNTTTQNTTTQ